MACYYCQKIHAVNSKNKNVSPRYRKSRQHPLCVEADIKLFTYHYIHHSFGSALFSIIMKRQRLCLDCTEHMKLLTHTANETFLCKEHHIQTIIRARLASRSHGHSLLACVQYVVHNPFRQALQLSNIPDINNVPSLGICTSREWMAIIHSSITLAMSVLLY